MPGRSALIVPIALPVALRPVRDAADRMAGRGVPAHVTILFPFLADADLGPPARAVAAEIAAHRPAFVARFDHVERHDEMVWLVPRDAGPFLDLTAAVVERWPDHPPYGGIHDILIPHLTLVETDDPAARELADRLAREVGPFDSAVTEVCLIAESATGSWRTRWRLPLASGPPAD